MKLSKNGRKTQKAIRKALLLGLPVAGLLAMAGCGKEKESKEIDGRLADPYERTMGRIIVQRDVQTTRDLDAK